MNCGTLSRLRQAAGLLALSKFATLAPQQYNRRADSYLPVMRPETRILYMLCDCITG